MHIASTFPGARVDYVYDGCQLPKLDAVLPVGTRKLVEATLRFIAAAAHCGSGPTRVSSRELLGVSERVDRGQLQVHQVHGYLR